LFLPGSFLLYLLFYVLPIKIIVDEEGIEFITLLRKIEIQYSEIEDIKPQYTTRTLTLTDGDKEAAAVYYSIKRINKPMSLLLFGKGIYKHRELYKYLKRKSLKKG